MQYVDVDESMRREKNRISGPWALNMHVEDPSF